jgi:hypothetical protein
MTNNTQTLTTDQRFDILRKRLVAVAHETRANLLEAADLLTAVQKEDPTDTAAMITAMLRGEAYEPSPRSAQAYKIMCEADRAHIAAHAAAVAAGVYPEYS